MIKTKLINSSLYFQAPPVSLPCCAYYPSWEDETDESNEEWIHAHAVFDTLADAEGDTSQAIQTWCTDVVDRLKSLDKEEVAAFFNCLAGDTIDSLVYNYLDLAAKYFNVVRNPDCNYILDTIYDHLGKNL